MCFSDRADRDEDYHVPVRTVIRAPRPLSAAAPVSQTFQMERRSPRSSSRRLSQTVHVVERSPRQSQTHQVVSRTPRSSRRSVDVVERSPRTSRQSVHLGRVPSRRGSCTISPPEFFLAVPTPDPFSLIPTPDPFLKIPIPGKGVEIPSPQPYPVFITRSVPASEIPDTIRAAAPPPAPMAPTVHELRFQTASVRHAQEAPAMERERSAGQHSSTSSMGRDRRTTVEDERGVIENITRTSAPTLLQEPSLDAARLQKGLQEEQVEGLRSRAASRDRNTRTLEAPEWSRQSFRLSEERIKYDESGKRTTRTMQYRYR